MNPLSLNYFLTVAECRSITGAARKLFVSQQNISNHISRLEKEYGCCLFERKPEFHLTYEGEQVLSAAQKIRTAEQELRERLRDISAETSGCLTIGITPSRAPILLSALLPHYHRRYPGIEIRTDVDSYEYLALKLETGKIDLFLGFSDSFQPEDASQSQLILYPEELVVVIPASMMRQRFGTDVSEAVSLFRNGYLPEAFPNAEYLLPAPGSRIRKAADRWLQQKDPNARILLECANNPALLSLAARGMGITFSFRHLADGYNSGDLLCFPAESGRTEGSVILVTAKHRYLSIAVRNFIRLVKEICCQNDSKGGNL